MRIETTSAKGPHEREVASLTKIEQSFPNDWYGYSSLWMRKNDKSATTREIDIIIIAHDRILIADLKDGYGKFESRNGYWFQNGVYRGPSACEKIGENAKYMASHLTSYIKKAAKKSWNEPRPHIQPFVVFTNKSVDISGLSDTDKALAIYLDDFLKLGSKQHYVKFFKDDQLHSTKYFHKLPLWDKSRKNVLSKFFNPQGASVFEPAQMLYGEVYKADGAPVFVPSSRIYEDYRATSREDRNNTALLRLWDFSRLETGGGSEATRKPFAQREHRTLGYIQDRSPEFFNTTAVRALVRDNEYTVRYWELFDLSRNAMTLIEHARSRGGNITFNKRLEHAKYLISAVADLHQIHVAHRDIGSHSVWLEGGTLKLSHFGVAHFPDPDAQTLSEKRIDLMGANIQLPEDFFGEASTPFAKDVFLTASLVWELLTGQPLRKEGNIPVLDGHETFPEEISRGLASWFETALNAVPGDRYKDGPEMLEAFINGSKFFKNDAFSYADEFVAHKQDIFPMASYPPNCGGLISHEAPFLWRHKPQDEDGGLFVKYWPANSFKDAAVSEFLHRAQKLSTLDLDCTQTITNFGIASDGTLFLVTEEVDGSRAFDADAILQLDRGALLQLCQQLLNAVEELHQNDLFHGDIKPDNIVLAQRDDAIQPVLIDIPDYSPSGATDLITARYTPQQGDGSPHERDIFAICQCLSDVLDWSEAATSEVLSVGDVEALRDALHKVVAGSPPNQTLHLVKQSIERLLHPSSQPNLFEDLPEYYIGSPRFQNSDTFAGDDNRYAVFVEEDTKRTDCVRFQIAGAAQVLNLSLSKKDWSIENIALQDTPSTQTLNFIQKRAQHTIHASMTVGDARLYSIGKLKAELQHAYEGSKATQPDEKQSIQPEVIGDDAADLVVAPTSAEWTIKDLWRATLEAEEEQAQEIIVTATPRKEGAYYVVSYDTPEGQPVLNYDPDDQLELQAGTMTVGYVDARSISTSNQTSTMKVSQPRRQGGGLRLAPQGTYKIVSSKALQSLRRRKDALNAIIDNKAIIHNLMDYFSPQTALEPVVMGADVSDADLAPYKLNHQQTAAFKHLCKYGPLGLLQGPPGTGKTHFIASFCHFAITKGGVRNILVLSQANASTNHAVEKVMDFAEIHGGDIEIIRVGNQERISDRLIDLHSSHLQDSYRQHFKAEMLERVLLMSRRLGLTREFVQEFYKLTTLFTETIEQIVGGSPDGIEGEFAERRMSRLLKFYELESPAWLNGDTSEPEMFMYKAKQLLLERHGVTNHDAVKRLEYLIRISRRWLNVLASKNGSLENFFVRSRSVVSGTCVGIGHKNIGLEKMQFDLVIIDEAARCTAGELAVGLKVASRVLLVGDHKQLLPMIDHDILRDVGERVPGINREEIKKSDFERIFSSHYGKLMGQTLTEQYRMADDIAQMVSDEFYPETALVTGRGPVPSYYEGLPAPFHKQLVWVDTSDVPLAQGQDNRLPNKSYNNRHEADLIITMLETLSTQSNLVKEFAELSRNGEPTIGVICTYRAQAKLIRQRMMLKEWPEGFEQMVKVDTIDSYQGKDNEIIIVSLTRRNSKNMVGHVANLNRINVALSRAKNRLVIVGCRDVYAKEWADNPLSGVAKKVMNASYSRAHRVPSKKIKAG